MFNDIGEVRDLTKSMLRKKLVVDDGGAEAKFLPSLLTVAADIMSNNFVEENRGKCQARQAQYILVDMSGCEKQFYIYEEEHSKIFYQPSQLSSHMQILLKELTPEEEQKYTEKKHNAVSEDIGKVTIMELETAVIQSCFKEFTWKDEWVYHCDNYTKMLPLIFFFNPETLYCAIEQGMQQKDGEVQDAINRCVKWYILVDSMGYAVESEKEKSYQEMHQMRILESLIVNNDAEFEYSHKSAMSVFEDVATAGFTYLRSKVRYEKKQRELKKILGRVNYNYIRSMEST